MVSKGVVRGVPRCHRRLYSILKDHAKYSGLRGTNSRRRRYAQDAYEADVVHLADTAGRGLQHMGTEYIHTNRNGSRCDQLFNTSPQRKFQLIQPMRATISFVRLMEMSMSGIGVGLIVVVQEGSRSISHLTRLRFFVVPDTRRGGQRVTGKVTGVLVLANRKNS